MKSIDACADDRWSILTWNREDGEKPVVRPFRCGSWRHEGACREHCLDVDFARISVAIKEHQHWTYCVLTFDPSQHDSRVSAFKIGVTLWSKLRKRIVYEFGNIKYIQTWEIHGTGWPHVNVLISNKTLWDNLCGNWRKWRKMVLNPMVIECGFGKRFYVQRMKHGGKMSSYLVKLGMELAGYRKDSQIPVNAPRHFRRIRTSRKLLPPRTKNEKITGCLMRMPANVVESALDDR